MARTEGASPAYIKELLRKAAVLAAGSSAGEDDAAVIVTGAHLDVALAELDEGGRLARRLLGFRQGRGPVGTRRAGAGDTSPASRRAPPGAAEASAYGRTGTRGSMVVE